MDRRTRGDTDHEPSDADDRVVELHEPAAPEPPIDDEDRDPAVQQRRRRRGPAIEGVAGAGEEDADDAT
ncbi:MAG TPA: hypothetical protein VHF89_17070 [Solirubrobacteraceae bacterium]|nr:hypothetical protein [Solirubrobacteraceae bacterium]